jgi:hypothetical protein
MVSKTVSTGVSLNTSLSKQENTFQYLPLVQQVRTTIDTNEAAFHLGRKPQTLRKWACHEDGPVIPIRINGRLAWSVAKIRSLTNGGA